MTKKQAIKRAEKIDDQLKKLQFKIEDLLCDMDNEGLTYDSSLKELVETLEALHGFDLEDSILIATEGK